MRVEYVALCLLTAGCFDFGGLKPKAPGDAGVSGDAAPSDADCDDDAGDCGAAERAVPKFWREDLLERWSALLAGAQPLEVAAGEQWVIRTSNASASPFEVFVFSDTLLHFDRDVADQTPDVTAPAVVWEPVTVGAEGAGVTAALVPVASLTVREGGELYVIGERPVIFAASEDIEIAGLLDVGGWTPKDEFSGAPGAGASNSSTLRGSTGTGTLTFVTGGAGGSHATEGAAGGQVAVNRSFEAPARPPIDAPVTLRGGGGGGSSTSAKGGPGGGAVHLLSLGSLVVTGGGCVSAGGAGGGSQSNVMGYGGIPAGAGGGAGGLVVLEAPNVVVRGVVAANGGAGGEASWNDPEDDEPLWAKGAEGNRGACVAPAPSRVRPLGRSVFGVSAGSSYDGKVPRAGEGTGENAPPSSNPHRSGSGGGGGAGFVLIRYGVSLDINEDNILPRGVEREGKAVTPIVEQVAFPSLQ